MRGPADALGALGVQLLPESLSVSHMQAPRQVAGFHITPTRPIPMVTVDPNPFDIEHVCPECGLGNARFNYYCDFRVNVSKAPDWGGGYQCSNCNIVFWPDLPDVGVVHLQTLF